MTDEQAIGLGLIWLSLGLKWMEGMLAISLDKDDSQVFNLGTPQTWRVSGVEIDYLAEEGSGWTTFCDDCAENWATYKRIPDFRDPATLGCLLAQAREVYEDPELYTYPTIFNNWYVNPNSGGVFAGDTEAEALVAALVAALEEAQ